MKRRSPKTFFEFLFHPLGVVDGVDYEGLSTMLSEQVEIPSFKLRALRRRDTWAIELPPGAFSGDLSGAVSLADDLLERERIIRLIKDRTGAVQMDKTRDMIERGGVWYYRRKALEQFRIYVQPNYFFVAVFKLLKAAEEDPSYIMGEKPTQARPLSERPIVNGRRAPGPRWRERDDYVLRKWFGKWADGKHHPLTDTQWVRVLEELGGFRSKAAVKHRLSVLNAQLKRSLMRDGYIQRDDVKKYQDGFLGELVVVPRFRPRLHGDYYPKSKQRNPASSLLRSDGTSSRAVTDAAKKRILANPPPGFVPTTVLTHLDLLTPRDEEAAEPQSDGT
jgi:hypothetical protein